MSDVKKPVRKITTKKMVSKPRMNEINSPLDLDFRLTLTKMGRMGKMQGDNIDITPVENEINGRISIYISFIESMNSSAET